MSVTQDLLLSMLEQNKLTCSFALDRVSSENSAWRLNPSAASIGFIYRHIGETMNLFGYFFGIPPAVPNTTMGKEDKGQRFDLEESHRYISIGFEMLENLVRTTPASDWSQKVDTPFFGTVSKIRLFSHILFHNAHHAGQIALTLSRGS
ncbi:DinB family protein [Algoriphagus sp. H41]|uniref:DinB family protein n=1 Tax=Algoriphagus oliviformis TaxID=2811231 RepID=A0ABS3C527_9BACT|nr:DinB family protein [Algoriphagus oliviformis]MBN7811694.1 DinB family protein [Algoriphagus oliviformis]